MQCLLALDISAAFDAVNYLTACRRSDLISADLRECIPTAAWIFSSLSDRRTLTPAERGQYTSTLSSGVPRVGYVPFLVRCCLRSVTRSTTLFGPSHGLHHHDYAYADDLIRSTRRLRSTESSEIPQFGERAFSFSGPSAWNALSADIRDETCTA